MYKLLCGTRETLFRPAEPERQKAILEAVAAGLPLEHVFHDSSVRPGRLSALTSARPRIVSRTVLERLADSKTPQHLLAVARRRDVPVAGILERPGPAVFAYTGASRG